jgi:hypothetical protein
MILLIDGDAIPFMIGWHHREHQDIPTVHQAIDQWFKDFFTITQANKYIGVIAHDNARCFRYDLYRYKPYKGNRAGEKEEWITFWEPVIRQHLQDKYGFVQAPEHLETDDVVAALNKEERIICSPDKDMRQMTGFHMDYRKVGQEQANPFDSPVVFVDHEQATYNLWKQVLTGDTTDNINGVTGMGDVKAEKLLKESQPFMYKTDVAAAFQKQYGPFYGPVIFEETLHTIKLMTPSHPLWETYGFDIEKYEQEVRAWETHLLMS